MNLFTVPTTSERPYRSLLLWACQWHASQPLSSPQLSHNDSLWAYGITKSHREQGLYYGETEELSWWPSWSNSLWHGWSCGLVYCPDGNATYPIWRVLASSDRISFWPPLKPQHRKPNPNSNPLADQLWYIDFLTPPTPLIIPYRLPAFLESLMPLKNWCSIHARWSKTVWSIPYVSVAFSPTLKQIFISYRSSKVSWRPDCIFEIHQLWQSGFSKVYSNSCCSCSFEAEIIKLGQSSHKMDSNNIVYLQESMPILNACTKKSGNLLKASLISYHCIIRDTNLLKVQNS